MPYGFETRLNRSAVVGYDGLGALVPRVEVPPARGSAPSQEGRRDMDVRGVGSVSGASPIRPTAVPPATRESAVSMPQAPRDELEISAAGKMLDQLSQSPDVRQARLAQIKEAIANGSYDTDEKLEAALSKMFDTLGIELDDE